MMTSAPARPGWRLMLAVGRLLLLVACLPAVACSAEWHAVTLPSAAALPAKQQVQRWREGRSTRLHGIALTNDSVTGVPFLQPLSCDSCRVGFARAGVDSLRVGDPPGGFVRTAVVTLVAVLAIGLVTGKLGPQGS